MGNLHQHYNTRKTPQSQPIPGSQQVENSAGGFAFAVDDWTRLDRFLILGSEGGSYYAGERQLTIENAEAVRRCLSADGARTVHRLVTISQSGRAPKNDYALFALAMAASKRFADAETRALALSFLPAVARTGTHLFQFVEYAEAFRGWGRTLRRAVANWYTQRNTDNLALQLVKYRQRGGWSHRDLLRLSHPQTNEDEVVRRTLYAMTCGHAPEAVSGMLALPGVYRGAMEVAQQTDAKAVAALIEEHNLPREVVPSEHLNDPNVWDALLPHMPLTAMIRNLGKMTAVGLLKPMNGASQTVVDKLGDREALHKARIHPFSVLLALGIYQQGHGHLATQRANALSWQPVQEIVEALDEAYYMAFDNVEPTGKRFYLGVDVSGSMGCRILGSPVTAREGAAAMAMVTARMESKYVIRGFTAGRSGRNFGLGRGAVMEDLGITARDRLDDAVRKCGDMPFGGTDCSLPMIDALNEGIEADVFMVLTDSETWAGDVHPVQALQQYRERTGINAKLVVVGMVSNGFSIADPDDPGMMDVVGFDAAAPAVIADFCRE